MTIDPCAGVPDLPDAGPLPPGIYRVAVVAATWLREHWCPALRVVLEVHGDKHDVTGWVYDGYPLTDVLTVDRLPRLLEVCCVQPERVRPGDLPQYLDGWCVQVRVEHVAGSDEPVITGYWDDEIPLSTRRAMCTTAPTEETP